MGSTNRASFAPYPVRPPHCSSDLGDADPDCSEGGASAPTKTDLRRADPINPRARALLKKADFTTA